MTVIASTPAIDINYRMATVIDRIHQFPEGCDPDFDNGLEELEREFAALRLQLGNE